MGFSPYLVAASIPAYCSSNNWIAIRDKGNVDRIYYVKKVERLWKDTETSQTNGKAPCLLYINGESYPWYFKTGWESVRSVYFGNGGGGD